VLAKARLTDWTRSLSRSAKKQIAKMKFGSDSTVPRANQVLELASMKTRQPSFLQTEWTRPGTECFLVPLKRDGRLNKKRQRRRSFLEKKTKNQEKLHPMLALDPDG